MQILFAIFLILILNKSKYIVFLNFIKLHKVKMGRSKKNIVVDLDIETIGLQGVAVGKIDGMVYFVKGAVAGDKVRARVFKKKKSYSEARILEFLHKAENRIEPKCDYFEYCGGCSWQMLSYADQLYWKERHVREAFQHIGAFKDINVTAPLQSPTEYHYRNKMEFSFGTSRWLFDFEIESDEDIKQKEFALGLHIPGRYDKIIDVKQCHIHQKINDKLLEIIRDKAIEMEVTAYHNYQKVGFLRNFVLRYSKMNNDVMVVLVTNKFENENEKYFIDWFNKEFALDIPEVTNVIHAVNDRITPVAIGKIKTTRGTGYLTEKILGIEYQISPFSFFQTNPFQLDNFIGKIIDYANIDENHTIWDLYCGTGSITLPASKKCKNIVGIELVESSIKDAKYNAKINEIDNVQFYCEDLHKKDIPELLNSLPKPDTIIIDPPRAGMHKNLVHHLLKLETERIVYVSCNPATQARDCEILAEKYEIELVTPVDMFPQTYHIEAIAILKLKK